MPQELEFSIMAESPANIQPLLDQFEADYRIRVRLRLLTWDIAWSDLVKVALYGDGPDVSDQETAVTITGPWLFAAVSRRSLADQVGVALPPGPSFVGGSCVVVWKHTRQTEAALQLIHFLTRTPTQVTYPRRLGLLPARLDALEAPPFSTDPLWQLAITGIRTGRSVPITRSWGLMEDRLTRELTALWADVLADPALDLEAAIGKRLEPLAMRLDLVLGQH
jgi:multiple sugar transport system substrate-binding protein